MKTRDLIKLLIEADPTGEEHCTVHGKDIHNVELIPGYYDGSYEKLLRDERGHIVGGVISREGSELRIKTTSIADEIFDCEADGDDYFPVCVRDGDGSRMEDDHYYWERINKARKQARDYYEKTLKEQDENN